MKLNILKFQIIHKFKKLNYFIKDSTPGPGYYYNEKLNSSFNQKIVRRFRNFPSTNRFDDFSKANPNVGPGKYEINQNLLQAHVHYRSLVIIIYLFL